MYTCIYKFLHLIQVAPLCIQNYALFSSLFQSSSTNPIELHRPTKTCIKDESVGVPFLMVWIWLSQQEMAVYSFCAKQIIALASRHGQIKYHPLESTSCKLRDSSLDHSKAKLPKSFTPTSVSYYTKIQIKEYPAGTF